MYDKMPTASPWRRHLDLSCPVPMFFSGLQLKHGIKWTDNVTCFQYKQQESLSLWVSLLQKLSLSLSQSSVWHYPPSPWFMCANKRMLVESCDIEVYVLIVFAKSLPHLGVNKIHAQILFVYKTVGFFPYPSPFLPGVWIKSWVNGKRQETS